MGYAVHIRRRSGPIALDEWLAFARAQKDFSEVSVRDDLVAPEATFKWRAAAFVWRDGEVTVDHLEDDWCAKLGEVADRLAAEAQGDDGERYLSDGRVDYGEGAQTLQRVDVMAALEVAKRDRVDGAGRGRIPLLALAVIVAVVAAFLLLRRS